MATNLIVQIWNGYGLSRWTVEKKEMQDYDGPIPSIGDRIKCGIYIGEVSEKFVDINNKSVSIGFYGSKPYSAESKEQVVQGSDTTKSN